MFDIPVAKKMCSTCPWREGSPMEHLRSYLEDQSFKESRICHSTSEIIVEEATRVSDSPLVCRGSRNYQLQFLVGLGFLTEPTDEAWERRVQEMKGKNENAKNRGRNNRDQLNSSGDTKLTRAPKK